jgi:hypothetical protein
VARTIGYRETYSNYIVIGQQDELEDETIAVMIFMAGKKLGCVNAAQFIE